MPKRSLPHHWLLVAAFGLLALGGYVLAETPLEPDTRTAGSGQVGASFVNDLTVSVGGGDLNATLSFNTSPLKNNDGSVAIGVRMAMVVTKPDASTVSYKQLTDADGRIRGQIYDSVIDQTGTYTITAQVDGGGPSDSANFLIREHAQLDRDNQVFTGDNQTFRNDTDSATAFRIQDAGGTDVLNVDTLTNTVTVANLTVTGTCTGCGAGGSGDLQDAYDNGNTITSTDARDIDITLADTATDANFTVDIASGSTGRFAVQAAGVDTFSVGATGAALFKNSVNSSVGLQVQRASGAALFTVNTSNASVNFADNSGNTLATISENTGLQVKTSGVNAWTNLGTDGSADILQLYDTGGSTVAQVTASGIATFTTPADGFHVRSGDVGTRSSIQIGRTSAEALVGVPGVGGQYSSDANAGDFVLRTNSATAQLILQNGTGAGNIVIDNGNTTIKPTTDSTAAFQVQNAAGSAGILTVDTANAEVEVEGTIVVNGDTHIDSDITVFTTTPATDKVFGTAAHSDTFERFRIYGDGKMEWGPGGVTARDTNLYRSAADTLKTDDALVVGTLGSGGTTALCSNAGQISTCTAGSGASTLQSAYDNGNTVTTTDARDLDFTLADTTTDANFVVDVAASSTGQFQVQKAGTTVFAVDPDATGYAANQPTVNINTTGVTNPTFKIGGDQAGGGTIRFTGSGGEYGVGVVDDDLRFVSGTPVLTAQLTNEGQLQIPVVGDTAGLMIGGTAHLFSPSTNILATNDSFVVRDGSSDIITMDPFATGLVADEPSLEINTTGVEFPTLSIGSTDQAGGGALQLKSSSGEFNLLQVGTTLAFHDGIATRAGLQTNGQFYVGGTGPAGGALITSTQSSNPPLALNRTANDGTLIDFLQEGVIEGTVSVSGTTVSYNAFTGSHYATVGGPVEHGMLVSMTGDNGRLGDRAESEIIYGARPTAQANDSAVLGAYLSVLEPDKAPESTSNPSLVTAVGNGEMWVADNGRDIEPGDGLISSDVAGHAMKDPGTHAVSHVVAKAAERVDWDKVTEKADGTKHAKISVLFGAFDQANVQGDPSTVQADTSLFGMLFGNTGSRQDALTVTGLATVGELVVEGDATFEGTVELNDEIRGKDVEVRAGRRSHRVTFSKPQPDADYAVSISPSWVTAYGVSEKTAEGFRIEFAGAAPADAAFDWFVLR